MGDRIIRRGLTVLIATALVTSCSTSIEGTPIAGTSTQRLATGNYPTAPRSVTALRAADAWQQEAWRIADAVIGPWEVDPKLFRSVAGESGDPLVSVAQLAPEADGPGLFTSAQVTAMRGAPFQAGFISIAGDTDPTTAILRVGILRYEDPGAATRGLTAILAGSEGKPPAAFDGIAGARLVFSGTIRDATRVTAVVPQGNLLIVASTDAHEPRRAETLSATALRKQSAKAPSYRQTSAGGANITIPPVPMDSDGLMSLTIPATTTSDSNDQRAGLSPGVSLGDGYRSMAAQGVRYPISHSRVAQTAAEYGIQATASTRLTTVVRTRDTAAARLFLLKFVAPTDEARASGVPGLAPDVARCAFIDNFVDERGTRTPQYRCGVQVESYVATITMPTLTQAQQATAAEYLILRQAP
ncbi:DUF7373 family lipoprotein [Tsukamurella sp. DT100]|uniref:DUF7373 family lipoprotein n=1 Tax=Tsukamurella sp. DT100 TaxID=3393415 RepID=UPI003CEFF841